MGLVCSFMLFACGRARPDIPTVNDTPVPVIRDGPSDPDHLSKSGSRSVQQIHERLLQDAQHQFELQNYEQAIRELRRLLALDPQETFEQKGHWLLGQSYDRLEHWKDAQAEYRWLASMPIGQDYQIESAQRLQEIQELLEPSMVPPEPTKAIRFTLDQLPMTEGFDQGIHKMKQDGITTLLVDLGCGPRRPVTKTSAGRSTIGHRASELRATLQSFSQRSHRAGLQLYVGINFRCLGYWASSTTSKDWYDRSYQIDRGAVKTTRWFDLFHPGYQQFVNRFLTRLCKVGVDGLVFLNDHHLTIYDGVTQIGLKKFQKRFQARFQPSEVFYPGFNPLQGAQPSTASPQTHDRSTNDSLFWRWAGWKARERLTVIETVVDALRTQYPSIQYGLEIHPHALTDPVRALAEYAEDGMDAAGRSFSFFFVRPELDRRSAFSEQTVIDKLRRISTKAVLSRLLPVVDDPKRVWVSLPSKGVTRVAPNNASRESSLFRNFPSGIGVVHDLRAFS